MPGKCQGFANLLALTIAVIIAPALMLLIAVIAGVTSFIPFFGPLFGAISCALLQEDPTHCLMYLILSSRCNSRTGTS